MGVTFDEAVPSLMEGAKKMGASAFSGFERGFFAKLVPNVRKLGLLDANAGYLRRLWGDAGLLEFEFYEDTSNEYGTYDEVARDRLQQSGEASAAQS